MCGFGDSKPRPPWASRVNVVRRPRVVAITPPSRRVFIVHRANRLLLASIALIACAVAPFAAHAQQDEAPTRAGRVADVAGQLFVSPEDRADEWAASELNYPIGSGDNLWLSGEGRAEVDFGFAQLRIAGDTNVHVSRLDERDFSLFVAQGRAIIAVRVLEQGDSIRVDTPNTQVELARPGVYRVDVSDDRAQTTVVVREGEATMVVAGSSQPVLPGQTATLFGTADVRVEIRNGIGVDGFDTWSASRDRRYARARSTTYVSNQMVGYADLDEYGSWQTYPDYGAVWFPTTVAPDWAPYRHGRWVSMPVWGWTWVDYAPWGYAPSHYGRWAYIGGRWGWCPGAYVRRPAWAPALVAWFGGSGWTFAASSGPVYGWVPLGWREPYAPAWRHCGSRCWYAYNKPYAVNVAERPWRPTTYVNHAVPGAITAVPGAAFASGKPVAPNVVRIPPSAVASAPQLGNTLQVKPLPIGNAVRVGNGAPPPASAIARTKPMQVAPAPSPNAVMSAPQGKPLQVAPVPRAPVNAVPPNTAINSAPPARAQPQSPQIVPVPPVSRSEKPNVARPVPQPQVAPPPAGAAVPQIVPVPQQRAAPAAPPHNGAPAAQSAPAPAPRAVEKPVPARGPQPAT